MLALSGQTGSQRIRYAVENEYHNEDEDDHIGDIVPVGVGAHRFPQFQADAARPHDCDFGHARCPETAQLSDAPRKPTASSVDCTSPNSM